MKKLTTCTALLGLFLAGCAGVLPKETNISKAPWENFAEARQAFEAIEVGKSDLTHLNSLGFSPTASPNVEALDYVDFINRMSPIFSGNKLPAGIHTCLEAEWNCKGYLFTLRNIRRDRIGNVAADLLGFRKETKITGWQLGVTLALVNNVVVYKSWVGIPEIEEYEKRVIPLGPIQNLGDFLVPN